MALLPYEGGSLVTYFFPKGSFVRVTSLQDEYPPPEGTEFPKTSALLNILELVELFYDGHTVWMKNQNPANLARGSLFCNKFRCKRIGHGQHFVQPKSFLNLPPRHHLFLDHLGYAGVRGSGEGHATVQLTFMYGFLELWKKRLHLKPWHAVRLSEYFCGIDIRPRRVTCTEIIRYQK